MSKTISSQAGQECPEGSTTRAYGPERIKKLHERGTSKDDDIVCSAWKHAEVLDKEPER